MNFKIKATTGWSTLVDIVEIEVGDVLEAGKLFIDKQNILHNKILLFDDIQITRLYNPCKYCGTEQIECYGCPNMNCRGKVKE